MSFLPCHCLGFGQLSEKGTENAHSQCALGHCNLAGSITEAEAVLKNPIPTIIHIAFCSPLSRLLHANFTLLLAL